MNIQQLTTVSTADFEFGINAPRTCNYALYRADKASNGLIVYIPGFGQDLGSYPDVFCRKVAAKYDCATMTVDYFGIKSRPAVGAAIIFEQADVQRLTLALQELGKQTTGNLQRDLETIELLSYEYKRSITLQASIAPTNNEYQNFGVLPALDILNAIKDASQKYSINTQNIILIGSSYGGYIANLASKLAPGYFRAVFDNSSWAKPHIAYIAGREINAPEFVINKHQWMRYHLNVKSPWTLNTGLPNSMENEKLEIRSFGEAHVQQMHNQGAHGTVYLFCHSKNDAIAKTEEKMTMVNLMHSAGLRVDLQLIDKNDVDGHYIKNLNHGMDLSMLTFFDRCLERLQQYEQSPQSNLDRTITYPSTTGIYRFDLSQHPIAANLDYH